MIGKYKTLQHEKGKNFTGSHGGCPTLEAICTDVSPQDVLRVLQQRQVHQDYLFKSAMLDGYPDRVLVPWAGHQLLTFPSRG